MLIAQVQTESASQFTRASRPDLAEKEKREADVLTNFLPPLLSEAEIDHTLTEVIAALPSGTDPRRGLGLVFKGFYAMVDKSVVDSDVVKKRAEVLLAGRA